VPRANRSSACGRDSAPSIFQHLRLARERTAPQQDEEGHDQDGEGRQPGVEVRFRGAFAYVTAYLPDGDTMPLMRLRYGGSATHWGFAIYLASKNGYQDSVLATGDMAGAPEDALDIACGLYLGDPTAWM
jgi:hypothetical protein